MSAEVDGYCMTCLYARLAMHTAVNQGSLDKQYPPD